MFEGQLPMAGVGRKGPSSTFFSYSVKDVCRDGVIYVTSKNLLLSPWVRFLISAPNMFSGEVSIDLGG
jgi:hypothetical protein